jgi:glucose-6-phosphate isomerase
MLETLLKPAVQTFESQRILARIWGRHYRVWRERPEEIANRLGWLDIAERMKEQLPRLKRFTAQLQKEGFNQAVLLGMGGSSLAPEMFAKVFRVQPGYLALRVLDSTDPGAVLAVERGLDLAKTLFIVSTKSGGTVETLSGMKYFYNRCLAKMNASQAGMHFSAITDPGSQLEKTAAEFNFREIFLNDPNIGGRYSALSFFGLVPAALLGIDLAELLNRARQAMKACEPWAPLAENPAVTLGLLMGELAWAGRDKLTILLSEPMCAFGDWVEQLIAESTGKEGRGILPVVGEKLYPAKEYSDDRTFVSIRLAGEKTMDAKLNALESAGFPVLHMETQDAYDLGGQFFIWELATAIAGWRMGIHPFDQPNVEAAKVLAREMVAAYQQEQHLPEMPAAAAEAVVVDDFLAGAEVGRDYLGLHAYLTSSAKMDKVLDALRSRLFSRYHLPVTVGYGPRFLHSTGQLHKGDGGHGRFIQFTADADKDLVIPDEMGKPEGSLTFGVLEMAQALGDGQALQKAGRKVLRMHLGGDAIGGLKKLVDSLK